MSKNYVIIGGRISEGDKYIIGDSHVKTFCGADMECIEDRNSGAVKVEIIEPKNSEEPVLTQSEKITLKRILYAILDNEKLKDNFWYMEKDMNSIFKKLDNRSFEDARDAMIELDDNK